MLSYLSSGEYSMSVIVPDFTQLVTPTGLGSVENIKVEVDAFQPTQDFDLLYGAVCRLQENGSHYALLISNAGLAYAVIKSELIDNVFIPTVLSSGALPDRGPSGNRRVAATCTGDVLTLGVDGEELASVSDSSLAASGQVGLAAVSAEAFTGIASAIFDNFQVSETSSSAEASSSGTATDSAVANSEATDVETTDGDGEPPLIPAAGDDTVTGSWVGAARNDGVAAEELWFNLTQTDNSVAGEVYMRAAGETAFTLLGTLEGAFDTSGELDARLSVSPDVLGSVASNTGVMGVRLEFYGRPGGNQALGNLYLDADDTSPSDSDRVGSLELEQR